MSDTGPSEVVDARPPLAVVSVIFQPNRPEVFTWPADFKVDEIDFTRLDSLEIADIGPPPGVVEATAAELVGEGFKIEAMTAVGLSFSGTREDFEALGFDPFECGRGQSGSAFVPVPALQVPSSDPYRFWILRSRAAALEVGIPSVLVWTDNLIGKPTPADLEGVRHCLGPLAPGNDGDGIRIRLIDSGFAADWRERWPMSPNRPTDVHAIAELDGGSDESGHGTAVAAHILALAPKCVLSMRKFVDESGVRNYPVAAFQHAVGIPSFYPEVVRPVDVIVCSWVIAGTSVALQLEIANAIRLGILVVFASGNAQMRDEAPQSNAGIAPFIASDAVAGLEGDPIGDGYSLCPIAHPEVVSVGGVAKQESGAGFDSADYSPVGAYFPSLAFVYGNNSRTCPDIVGLTAPAPPSPLELPGLIQTLTSDGSTLDRKPDGGHLDDGMFRSAGTSMSAGQIAGIAAVLIQSCDALRFCPASVKNVLTNATRYGNDPPWDARLGHGVASAHDALEWLEIGFEPRIRPRLDERVPGPSPDIIIRGSVALIHDGARRLGQCFKHLGGPNLDDPIGRTVFVRVQNHGRDAGICLVTLVMVQVDRVITLVGVRDVHLDAGGFTVVGPFELPSRPAGAMLAAEVIGLPGHSILRGFVPLLPPHAAIPEAMVDEIKEHFAVRGV